MHVKIIKILEDYRNLPKDLTIDCKENVVVLVGDQGSGKSTLLNLLKDNDKKIKITLSEDVIKYGVDTFFFDTEKMNPRLQNLNNFSTPGGQSKGIGIGNALSTHFMSHGEALKSFTVKPLNSAKNSVIFLDEPESALSLKSQFELVKAIKKATKNNCQLFIATHSLVVIQSFKNIYDLEHHKWTTSEEYLKSFN